jgi:geranylgeranyl pyrophosphate synthase|tara:strand:+ start:2006 stop:2971 length:966 start_codon:yes stop_codon:yes gene_type:complete
MKLKTKLQFTEELNNYYQSVKLEFEDFLKIEIAKESKELAPLIEKGVLGGKMLRPVLCRLISDALEGDAHLAFECGMALELIHGGALIHDDWIDGDSFRRAAPALWEELGSRTAVLVADLMIATGSLHGAISIATGKSLANCIRSLSEGAIADFTDKQNYSESVYLHRVKKKTGALYGTAAELGALVSSEDQLGISLYKYGETVGIIYQITDDYLDLYNSIATRTPVGDLAMGIPTLPVTRLAKYSKYQGAVETFLSSGDSKEIIETVDLSEAQGVYEELVLPWVQVARKSLTEVPDSRYKTLLEEVPVSFSNHLISSDKN